MSIKFNQMKGVKTEDFRGHILDKKVEVYNLSNTHGIFIQITNYGGKIVSLYTPDRQGQFADIVIGYDTIQEYIKGQPYYGAICGRFANRIAFGKFTLNGKEYSLALNNGKNSIHGGINGFNNVVWDVLEHSDAHLKLYYLSVDGEEGFPGNLSVIVEYSLNDANEFSINYQATTDATTIVNLTSHSFFNMAGEGSGSVLDHHLKLTADRYTPLNDSEIPTGELHAVQGTPMDFTLCKPIGRDMLTEFDQVKNAFGYNHNWVLPEANGVQLAAVYTDPISGRGMEIHTDQPGIQVYVANWLDEPHGKGGKKYTKYDALCLETQNFPDAPNQQGFPSPMLNPGDTYRHVCIHKFFVD